MLLVAALAISCAHVPIAAPSVRARVVAPAVAQPTATIVVVGLLDDPDAAVACPEVEWVVDGVRRATHASDCSDPSENHSDRQYLSLGTGEHEVVVVFTSLGKHWSARAVILVTLYTPKGGWDSIA